MRWNNFGKKKPPKYDYVLIYAGKDPKNEPDPITLGYWDGREWTILFNNQGVWKDLEWDVDTDDVTHWMRLPPTPEKR